MKKTLPRDCPTILDRDTLLCDNDMMSADRVRNSCYCIQNGTCVQIAELLKQGKDVLAYDKIEGMKNRFEG